MGNSSKFRRNPPLWVSLLPIISFLAVIVYVIVRSGAESAQDISQYALLGAAALAVVLSKCFYHRKWKYIVMGIRMSAKQILPTFFILVLIATVSATWMMSGTVPALIDYGLMILNPQMFLVIACIVCSIVSVMSGSSWTTIATIGVAFMGIGEVFGYSTGWVAGAIISGAYFGDKVSPLSDTTVLASATAGVP
ncbi:MAG: Na+/H+ antiporter NhaC family protein, partial [Muribaculaceae bacterium]